MITPEQFRTIPCPTYPEIRLSLASGGAIARLLDDFRPEAVHIATEGPLGWAARRYCLKRNVPFTTAYHTRFPEYVRARTKIPVGATYRLMRRFHRPASGVMVATRSMEQELTGRGFRNLRRWSRGVDTELFRVIQQVLGRHFPGVPVTTKMLTGATESVLFRPLGIACYGFTPLLTTAEETATGHGDDERISQATVRRSTGIFYEVVRDIAARR